MFRICELVVVVFQEPLNTYLLINKNNNNNLLSLLHDYIEENEHTIIRYRR